ncbi:MAG: hypothetical protein H0W48_00120 [Methylibium sp.]|uniref:hypothetical protein n=1 Tax=Methylibium sp. TaxID=2067992 RepID=UPI00183D1712|nr:hypothetical protein [Methylibium sp.]MBA3588286.1 hypothetical protein [Methylibium sp.]MBA3622881.1 hypothetical protein [Methylibium sp.]
MNSINELRIEIADCNQAIKAFKLGLKHLAPAGLDEAPSVVWLEMQKAVCSRKISEMRAQG